MDGFLAKAPLFFAGFLFFSLPLSVAGGDFSATFLILLFLIALGRKKTKFEFNFLAKAITLFLVGFVLSSLASTDVLLSLSYAKRFWKFLLPFAIYWALKDQDLGVLFKWLLLSSIPITIYGLIQYYTGLDIFRSQQLQHEYHSARGVWHAVGAFSHHLTYGGVCLLLFGLFLGLASQKGQYRLWFLAAATLNLLAIFASHGRSSWLGALVIIAVLVIAKLPKKVAFILFLLAVISFTGLYQAKDSPTLKKTAMGKRLSSAMSSHANRDRLYMWEAGVNMIADRPIFGFGASTNEEMSPYYEVIAKKYKHQFQHEPTMGVHNLYLQSWINFGFLGFISLMFWWVSIPWALIASYFKHKKSSQNQGLKIGLAAGLIGSLVGAVFEINFRDAEVQTVILTFHGLALVLLAKQNSQHNSDDTT